MRNLNDEELSAVAGGVAHAASTTSTPVKRPKSKNLHPSHFTTLLEEPGDSMDDGDGGGDGGGDSGGDSGGDGDAGGDSGDVHDGETTNEHAADAQPDPVNMAANDSKINKITGPNDPVNMTCKGTSGGGSQCVTGTASNFVVTSYDTKGDLVATTACHPTSGWSLSMSMDLFKRLNGGTGSVITGQPPGFTCDTTFVPRHG